MSFTRYSQQTYDKYKDIPVSSIEIRRNSINKALNVLISTIENTPDFSFNKIEQDKYYHLYMVITLSNNTQIQLDKQEVVNISTKIDSVQNDMNKLQPIIINNRLTLKNLIENTKKIQGNDFYNYDAYTNNCQKFVMNILEGSNIKITETYKDFITQDLTSLIKTTPWIIKKISDAFIAIGGHLRKIKEDIGFKHGGKILKNRKKLSRKNNLF